MNRSRLLTRLESEIASASDGVNRDCKIAELCCYLARRGKVSDIAPAINDIRTRYRQNPNLLVSIWAHLAEGLSIQFSDMGPLARDKFNRAYALSVAGSVPQLQALCAAWLAHLNYLSVDVIGMAKFATEAIALADETNHAARSRANLVVADALHLANRIDLALPWYQGARHHASTDGDDATISALMHNMAWLRGSNFLNDRIRGRAISPSGDHALVGVNSTIEFDRMIGGTGLHTLAPLLRAQLISANGEYSEALVLYEENIEHGVQQGMGKLLAALLADRAWCHFKLGHIDQAATDAYAAEIQIEPNGQHDDRALAHSRLAQVFAALGKASSAAQHLALADEAWESHSEVQRSIVTMLSGLDSARAFPSKPSFSAT